MKGESATSIPAEERLASEQRLNPGNNLTTVVLGKRTLYLATLRHGNQ
jgi:hypothetical protein